MSVFVCIKILHEGFYRSICHHLLRPLLVRFQDARVILTGNNGCYAKATALREHNLDSVYTSYAKMLSQMAMQRI